MPKLSQLLLLLLLSSCWFTELATARHLRLRSFEKSVPEPRSVSVSNGVAALSGYALGLSKALIGVFIYDVITANVTSLQNTTTGSVYAQQICFNTLSLDAELARSNNEFNPYDDDDVYTDPDEGDSVNLGRQATTTTNTDTATATGTSTDTTATTTSDQNSIVPTCFILYKNR